MFKLYRYNGRQPFDIDLYIFTSILYCKVCKRIKKVKRYRQY